MTVGDLLKHLRMRLTALGVAIPFEPVLIAYIDDAYRAFVNGMDGVADEITLTVPAGSIEIALPTYILRIKSAQRNSDAADVEVINRADTRNKELKIAFGTPGPIKYLMIGTKPNVAKVAFSPETNTDITLDVDRLPVAPLTTAADTLDDVPSSWHLRMLDHAVAAALFNSTNEALRRKVGDYISMFESSVARARREKGRAKSKMMRVVNYGGL